MLSLLIRERHLSASLAAIAVAAWSTGAVLSPAEAGKRRTVLTEDARQDTISGPPVLAVVSIRDQRVSIYDASGGSMKARVSSGRDGYETPVGVYSVLQKEEEHYSNLYDDASMPFMQRITWSGIALHSGQLPGYPASHGCVRLPDSFAQRLFPLTQVGMRVVVAYDNVAPAEISHPLLMKPTPPRDQESVRAIPMSYKDPIGSDGNSREAFLPDLHSWPARQSELYSLRSAADDKQILADGAIDAAKAVEQTLSESKSIRDKAAKALRKAEAAKKSADDEVGKLDKAIERAKNNQATKRLNEAKTRASKTADVATNKGAAATEALKSAEAELQKAMSEAAPTLAARDAAVSRLNEAKRKSLPISVFISLKTQRLYVRQGHEPVFDAPVTISEPDKPIGTHVFTAVDYKDGGNDVRWMAVSLDHRGTDYALNDDRARRLSDADGPPPTDISEAKAALDRITIPSDVAARLTSAVWPGSSVIISDEAQSKETGKATDFIVLISTEPQGGIKKRPKQFFRNDNFMSYSADDYYYGYDRYGRRSYPRRNSSFGYW